MEYSLNSRLYKFKTANLEISVTADKSCSALRSHNENPEYSEVKLMHNHAIHEFFFVGETPLKLYSENNSGEYKNCIVCIPPLFNHFSVRQGDYRIMFSFHRLNSQKNDFADFMDSIFEAKQPFVLNSNDTLTVLIKQFSELIESTGFLSDDAATCVLKLIFYNIFTLNSNTAVNHGVECGNSSYLIKIDSLLSDFQKDIKLCNVADALGLSTKQASRIIRKNYKSSLSQLIMQKRLRAACTLLTDSSMSVAEIVEYINFPSESYFYSQFKKIYGCTPNKYRKKSDLSSE